LKRGGAHSLAVLLSRYKVGDCFFSLPVAEVLELLAQSTARIDGEVEKLEASLASLHEEMAELKVTLYGRFGRSINLEL
jgi:prefoldin subunit 4